MNDATNPTTEAFVTSGDARLATQSFGEPRDPAVLLIMGQMASMLWWPEAFCRRLTDRDRFVIRYDHRDTGRSTSYEPGSPPYTFDDLAADAVAVLAGYGLERAHLVGMSLGGAVAQLVAIAHPAAVSSLTLISTTMLAEPDPELPSSTPDYLEHAAAGDEVDWADRDAVREYLVSDARQVASVRHPFDETVTRDFVAADLERTERPQSLVNHALLGGGEISRDQLGEIAVRALIIHGTADPIFPHEHGVALARALPAAELVTIAGGGHELHERDWGQIVDAIADHTAAHDEGGAST